MAPIARSKSVGTLRARYIELLRLREHVDHQLERSLHYAANRTVDDGVLREASGGRPTCGAQLTKDTNGDHQANNFAPVCVNFT